MKIQVHLVPLLVMFVVNRQVRSLVDTLTEVVRPINIYEVLVNPTFCDMVWKLAFITVVYLLISKMFSK